MRLISLADSHTIQVFQSIQELPAQRHLELQVYLVQAAGIGSTMQDVEKRFSKTAALLAAGKTEDAGNELANLHYAFHFALERFSPQQLAFGCLVASVDGEPMTDFSEEGLQALIRRLSDWGLTDALVSAELEAVKKNCRPN